MPHGERFAWPYRFSPQRWHETERSGRITKQGNKLARTALVQCALVAKRFSPYLRTFYQRIQCCRGGGKANIALAS